MSGAGPSIIDKEDLDLAKRTFEASTSTPTLKASITVRRRRRAVRHVAQDLLFSITFDQSDAGNVPVLTCLIGVHQILVSLVEKLKTYFDDKQRRLVFFSVTVVEMTSPIHSGGQDLHNAAKEDIVRSILEPLFAYLCSNSEVSLSSNLEVKCSVMSLDHTAEYDKKKRRLKRPPPEGHLVGHRGSSLKPIDHYSGSKFGFIMVPRGVPANQDLFYNRCLPVVF